MSSAASRSHTPPLVKSVQPPLPHGMPLPLAHAVLRSVHSLAPPLPPETSRADIARGHCFPPPPPGGTNAHVPFSGVPPPPGPPSTPESWVSELRPHAASRPLPLSPATP